MESITVRMLGKFSLQAGQITLSDTDNRTRKLWILLAYLLCHRGSPVSQQKLIRLLWGDEPSSANPENALRITFHRTRNLLNHLWPGAGHQLILRTEAGYLWNPDQPVFVDADRFDALCNMQDPEPQHRLSACLEAIGLYGGEFLEKQSAEPWVIPISAHYHNQYLRVVMEAAGLLSDAGQHKESAELCRTACAREPYHEPLYQLLIRELAAAGDHKGAAAVFEALSQRLFQDFGIYPSEETRQIYRTAVHIVSEKSLAMDMVLEQLQEPVFTPGAMCCDYDYFKVLCHAESRAMERTGNVTHIVLLSVSSGTDTPLPRRTLNRVMDQLGTQIRLNLRRGDTFSRCSLCQYIVMLPNANYENSCMVARRVLGAFRKVHPHVSAQMQFLVQPLTPNICVP